MAKVTKAYVNPYTNWYPSCVNPIRIGEYQRLLAKESNADYWVWDVWTGAAWTTYVDVSLPWRGLNIFSNFSKILDKS